ncbi:MAG: ERF family protein [Proteobacteria bacterium]|nr:ERF family protein [Pseudomonadota bacterium]
MTQVQEIDFGATTSMVESPSNLPAAAPISQPIAALEPVTIIQVIARVASDPTADIEKLERLLAMKERMDARQAQIEYDNAMSDAQEAMKPIRANLESQQTRSEYADYSALDKAVRPIYAKHGFSLSFSTAEGAPDNCVRIVCTVGHRSGHRERPHLDMPADGKGARGNDVMTKTHATGAAITYGKRYLLGMIFNLAVTRDDDGNGAGGYDYDGDIEANAPANALRDENGKLLSTYNAERARKAKDWADDAIQCINHSNAEAAKAWRDAASAVPKGKRKSPLEWLRDNSPGQYLRVRQAYQNVTGEDLE